MRILELRSHSQKPKTCQVPFLQKPNELPKMDMSVSSNTVLNKKKEIEKKKRRLNKVAVKLGPGRIRVETRSTPGPWFGQPRNPRPSAA